MAEVFHSAGMLLDYYFTDYWLNRKLSQSVSLRLQNETFHKWGPHSRPKHAMILVIGTPQKGLLIVGNSQIAWVLGLFRRTWELPDSQAGATDSWSRCLPTLHDILNRFGMTASGFVNGPIQNLHPRSRNGASSSLCVEEFYTVGALVITNSLVS